MLATSRERERKHALLAAQQLQQEAERETETDRRHEQKDRHVVMQIETEKWTPNGKFGIKWKALMNF